VGRLAFEQAAQPLVLFLWIGLGAALSWTWIMVVRSLCCCFCLWTFSFLGTLTYFPSLAAWIVLVCLSSCSAGEFALFVSQSFISVLYGSALRWILVGSPLDSWEDNSAHVLSHWLETDICIAYIEEYNEAFCITWMKKGCSILAAQIGAICILF
jgi:hypothetical protein